MKTLLVFLSLILALTTNAQIKKVTIQASGLTCSMCSNSINKSLKTIPYVEKVVSNIKTSSFEVSFKLNAVVNFDQLKKKVEDAGFFVAKFTAVVNFDKQKVENDDHVVLQNNTYHLLNIKDQEVSGDRTVQLLDKGYVSAKDFKKNAAFTKMECYKTGVAGSCCKNVKSVSPSSRIFHITLV